MVSNNMVFYYFILMCYAECRSLRMMQYYMRFETKGEIKR